MRTGFKVSLSSTGEVSFQTFGEPHPLVTYSENAAIVIGRIYYQEDLKEQFPKALVNKITSAADLVYSLYLNYGYESLTYLEGEFALVIYDAEQYCLLTLRDPLGSYPLYWTLQQDNLEISTHLKQLPQSSINLDFLASFLITPFAFVELDTEQTVDQKIQKVLPGKLLNLNHTYRVKKLWEWDWLTKIVPITDIGLPAAAEKFLELLQKAIAERMNYGKTASHLSGGMDSSAITCLAKELTTLSLVYKIPSLAPETKYIEMILKDNPGLDSHYVDGDNCLDFQWFEEAIPLHDEPYQGLCSFPMDRAIIKASAELGVNTILTGIGAEIITQGNRYYLGDLLRQGKYKKLLDAAKAWAKTKNTNLWAILYPFALYPLTPPLLKQGIPTLLRRGYAQDINLSPYSVPPWIKADFAKTYHLWEKSLDLMTPSGNTSLESSYQILGLKAFMGNWNNWYLANDVNIHLSHPFLDPRLITFCLGLPTALRENPYLAKPVLQEAMKGILPEPIRTRRYKANFNEVYGKGLNRHLPQLRQLILESGVEQLGIFDKQILIDKIEQQAIGLGNVVSGSRINNSLALIAWYKLTFGQKT